MQSIISIFREVRDPRDFNARYDCAAMLFIALAATLCGAKSCVDIADFAEANADALAELVDLPHGAPSHDSFSRLFRLLDPAELAGAPQALAVDGDHAGRRAATRSPPPWRRSSPWC